MQTWVSRALKLIFFFVALCSGVLAILLAWTAIPETGRNPGSPEFGWLRKDWLVGFLIANALISLAIGIASPRTRILFAVFLLIIWGASIVPAYQYCLYQLR